MAEKPGWQFHEIHYRWGVLFMRNPNTLAWVTLVSAVFATGGKKRIKLPASHIQPVQPTANGPVRSGNFSCTLQYKNHQGISVLSADKDGTIKLPNILSIRPGRAQFICESLDYKIRFVTQGVKQTKQKSIAKSGEHRTLLRGDSSSSDS